MIATLFQKYRFIQIKQLVFIFSLAILLSGCASDISSLTGRYGIKIKPDFDEISNWRYDYQRFRNTRSDITASFIDFYPLTVRWRTKAGEEYEERIEVKPLMEKLQKEQQLRVLNKSNKNLVVKIDLETFELYFRVFHFQRNPHKLIENKYLLYSTRLNRSKE